VWDSSECACTNEDKNYDTKYSFYEELERVFSESLKNHMKQDEEKNRVCSKNGGEKKYKI
jgi:hypothetical protein